MSKVIIIDAGICSHICIFAWGAMTKLKNEGKISSDIFIPDSDYNYFRMMIGFLKKIVVKKGDIVIVSVDARNSWRKAFYPIYKGQRKEMRESHQLIDWNYHYNKINDMNQRLNEATDWYFLKISNFINFDEICNTVEGKKYNIEKNVEEDISCSYGIEADDIQAVVCRAFPDREVVLVTGDADLDMLTHYKNTKIFSTNIKFLGSRGLYKIINDPLKIKADKIRKGDVSDNIIVDKHNDTEYQRNLRELIVDLLTLPSFVEDPIKNLLLNLPEKKVDYSLLPFKNSIGNIENYNNIYLPDKMVTWEQAEKAHLKKEKKTKEKRKISYEKQKVKRKLKKELSFK